MSAPLRTGWPNRLAAVLTSKGALPALAVLAFLLSLLIQRTIYPGASWNRDEGVYLWQVDVLRAGQLSTSDGGHPSLFQPWLSAARDGNLFSQYTLGWPLVLLAGAWLGSPDLGVAAGAALAVTGAWVLVREVTGDRAVATLTAAFLLVSPIFLVQAGVHLNYLFSLGLGLLAVAAALAGVRRRQPWRMVLAGVLLGWVFLTRPFDAAVWGLLLAVPLVVAHRRALRSLLGPAAWAGVGLLPLVAASLLVNRHLTGSLTEFPITVADPLDRFGFGLRRLMPGFDLIDYGPRLALSSSGRNSFWLPLFLVGAHLGLVVAALGAWVGRRDRRVHYLVALGVAFPLAYLPFFGTHVSSLTARLSGPIYYIPSYVPLCALAALAVAHLGRRRPAAALVVVGVIVAATVPVAVSRLQVNHDLSEANLPWARSVEQIEGRALVVPSPRGYLLYVNPFGDNGADLDDRILYAADGGPDLLRLVEENPDRTPYLQRADRSIVDLLPSEDTPTPTVRLTPMELLRGQVHLTGTATAPPGAPRAALWLELDGVLLGQPTVVEGRAPVDLDLAALDLPAGLHTLEVKLGAGVDVGAALRAPVVRRTFYVRADPTGLVLLAPGTAARIVQRAQGVPPVWEDALSLPELLVDPRLGPGS